MKRENSENITLEHNCRAVIGSLMYAMLCSRPNISISISILSCYQSCASETLRVLRYIQGTLHLSLVFRKDQGQDGDVIVGFSDSDWAGDRVDRKSSSGYKCMGALSRGHLVSKTQ